MFERLFKSQVQKEIEALINDLQLYLENNYKDLAIEARKNAVALVELSYKQGRIKDKSYEQYKKTLDEYSEEMKDYNHQQFYQS